MSGDSEVVEIMLRRIAFVHPFLLHYHYPRLSSLAAECQKSGISLYNIQLAGYSQTYHSLCQDSAASFNNQVLFPERDLFRIPAEHMQGSLRKALDEIRPDVLFIYGYSERIMRWARFWAEENRVASVVISDSNYVDKQRYLPLEWMKTLLVKRFNAAFVGGRSSGLYLERLGFPAERIVAGYDVIDNDSFRTGSSRNNQDISQTRRGRSLPQQYFLFVGRILKCKNVIGLIRSYAAYVQSIECTPWDLLICGDGPYEIEARNFAEGFDEEVRKHISFRGLIRQPALLDFFSGASCLVLPSTSESWGLTINEALACGLPVIVSNRCGCAMDLVENGVNGWQFDPANPGELTSRMLQMHLLDPERRADMGRCGQELISEWGLDRFCSGALKSADIAIRHFSGV